MFTICVDDNGYYTEGQTENEVEITGMPSVENLEHLFAYKYDEESKSLVLDNDKLKEILNKISKQLEEPTTDERLDAIESAISELASIIGGE